MTLKYSVSQKAKLGGGSGPVEDYSKGVLTEKQLQDKVREGNFHIMIICIHSVIKYIHERREALASPKKGSLFSLHPVTILYLYHKTVETLNMS